MIRYNGVYSAIVESGTYTGASALWELRVPAGVQIDILRMWVGAAEATDPVDEILEVRAYRNDAAGTGTAGMSEAKLRGSVDAATAVTAEGAGAPGATPEVVFRDAFHLQNGWLYLPVPEERIRVVGGSAVDNFGLELPVAPAVSIDLSSGVVWGEIG